MARRTRSAVSGLTEALLCRVRETVAIDTLARLATCLMVICTEVMWILHHRYQKDRRCPSRETDIKPLPISEVRPMIGLAFQNAGLQPSLFEIPINERAAY